MCKIAVMRCDRLETASGGLRERMDALKADVEARWRFASARR